jgi:UDP-glucose 4-epimerase
MSRVLVTGGAGFIGSHVADAFLSAGHQVFAVDNLVHGRVANVDPAVTFFQADLRDRAALEGIFGRARPEIISHHAALVSVRESLDRPEDYAAVNVLGGLNLLELARRTGVRKFIYANTGGALYGEGRDQAPFREDRAPNPLDAYGASKLAFEHYLNVYRHNFGLDYVSLRYANVYGPRQDPYGEGGVVAIFAEHMIAGRPCTINGNGEKVRDFVYAGDVAQANLMAMDRGSGVYNIATGVPTNIKTIFRDLRAAAPGYDLDPRYGPDKPGEVWSSCLDASLARRELGWAPAVSLADGLARTLVYFRDQPPRAASGAA